MKEFEQLIKDCIAGNQNAMAKLYRQFAPKMFGVCLRYAKDSTEAEDNLQDGFVKVFNNLKSFRNDGSLEGWIRRIMINVSLEKIRKQHLMYPVEDVAIYDSINYSDDVIAKISADDLMKLIQELPPRYQLVFNLYVIEGMSHQEIADEMSITQGTSKSNLARARDILKKKVQENFGEINAKNNYTA
ncbi:RNA polymerase ECF-type sigma factor [Aquipluma nitroreducens]|uniref:RNA polymerase ECF-type sigma factor n=2 Tax=Aquipluma nitroreducens TaxID=2010828 RepID=A0A5K7S6M8_9BACT|nr:RNA polymerase ECF-type sigma factor [Aquipluma nitroreducens]